MNKKTGEFTPTILELFPSLKLFGTARYGIRNNRPYEIATGEYVPFEKERDTWLKAKAGDADAVRTVIEMYLPIVVSYTRRIVEVSAPLRGLEPDDLLQEACIRVMAVIRAYNPDRVENLITGVVYQSLRSIRSVPVIHGSPVVPSYEFLRQSVLEQQRIVGIAEAPMNTDLETDRLLRRMLLYSVVHPSAVDREAVPEHVDMNGMLLSVPSHETTLDLAQTHALLSNLLNEKLDEAQIRELCKYFGFYLPTDARRGDSMTHAEMAASMNPRITHQAVSLRLQKILNRLRSPEAQVRLRKALGDSLDVPTD